MKLRSNVTDDEGGFTLVELLVAVVVMSIVMGGITSVVISTTRVESDQQELQQVVDDGRVSLTRIRQEVREARRILAGSDGSQLHFWVDRNQDALVQPEEVVCYAVEALDGTSTGRYRIARWEGADDGCSEALVPADAPTLASTLLDPEPFVGYTPEIPPDADSDPYANPVREIEIFLDLEVQNARGPGSVEVMGNIRLRNVP
ncbi:MAG: prepilin-type N-terminal cleavage/methylation domain-containing protein [Nitriliruptoraceae bacterium]